MNFDEVFDLAKSTAEPALKTAVDELKNKFVDGVKDIGNSVHKDKVADLFEEAGKAKLKAFMEKDPEEQRKLARIYELKVIAIETYVLSAKIVADAKAASLLKEMVKQLLDSLESVALAVLKTVATAVVSGAINGLTGGAGGALAAGAAGAIGALLQPDKPE